MAMNAKPGHSVIYTPELLHYICSFAQPSDLVHLCQTCQSVFSVTVPFIWETLNGVHKLLALLPNVTISRPDHRGGRSLIHITLPDPSHTSFERFDLYASYVKHVHVFGNNTYYSDISGWNLLSERARTRPLLPKLLSITVREYFSAPLDEEQLCQISDLISPSLISYWSEPVSGDQWANRLPKAQVMVLLDSMVERCTAIKRLAIYAKAGSQVCFDLPASFGSRAFHHLRELSGSAALVATDVIEIIGALPQLEYLAIRTFNQFLPPFPEELPPTSFPALKHLFFSTWFLNDAYELPRLHSLLSRFEFLELHIDVFAVDEESENDQDIITQSYNVISAWLERTFCLRKLHVDFDPDNNGCEIIDLTHKPIMTRITELQIETLHLNGISLGVHIFQDPLLDWSHLKELHLPQQHVTLGNLHNFAALPSLVHLKLSLNLSDKAVLPDQIWENRLLHTLESSEPSKYTCYFRLADDVASMLLKIWPNLREIRCDEPQTPEDHGKQTACTMLDTRIAFMRRATLGNVQVDQHVPKGQDHSLDVEETSSHKIRNLDHFTNFVRSPEVQPLSPVVLRFSGAFRTFGRAIMDGLIAYILQELAFEGDLGSDVSRLRQIISQYYSTQPSALHQSQNVDDKFCAFVWGLLATQDKVVVGVAPDGAAAVYFSPQASKTKGTSKGKSKAQPEPTSAVSLSPLSPDEIAAQPLDALITQYGSGLRIAVAPDVSFVCITGSHIRPPKLSTNAYAVLQLITRSRREGMSVTDISRQSGYDPKTCFYFIKILVELGHIHKIKVGGSAVNICVHKSFYDDQCIWKQAAKEETMEVDNPDTGPEIEGDEGGAEGAAKEFIGSVQFEPIDNRHMSNPTVVKARIERLLRHMPHGLHVYRHLLEAISLSQKGFKTSIKKERRVFTHRVTELLKSRFIEKVWAQSSTSTTGQVLCIRLVTNDHTLGSPAVPEDGAVDEPHNITLEGLPVAGGVDQDKVGATEDSGQLEGVYATQSVASQIISMVEESDTTGMTLSEISKSLHNFDIRSITNLVARFAAGQPPSHLAHRALVIVTEMFGRERRQRVYTLAAYRRMIEQEGLEDQSVLDSNGSGTWAVLEPDEFVANETEREEWLETFVREALVRGGEKAREQKVKKGRANPLDKDGAPIKGRPRKDWTQGAKAPKKRGRPPKRKADEVDEGDGAGLLPTPKKRRGRPPKTKPTDGDELVDNATAKITDIPLSATKNSPTKVTRKRGRPRMKQPAQPGVAIAFDQPTGAPRHEEPTEEPAGATEHDNSGGTSMDGGGVTVQNQLGEQSEHPTRASAPEDLIPRRISRSPSPRSSGSSHLPKRSRLDGPTEIVATRVIVPPTVVSPSGSPLEGLIAIPDHEREPTPEVEGANDGSAVTTGQTPDDVQVGERPAQPTPRQGKTTNVSALRRQTEFIQLIESMGGVANVSLLKSFNDEHQKLLLKLHAAGKAVSTAPGTGMDKRTFNSTISALEGRGLVKTLVVSALTTHGATRRATIVHLIGASPESVEKCIEAFRSSGSTKGIPLTSDYPKVPASISPGLNTNPTRPSASTPPTSFPPPTDPLSEARQAHLSEARTAAQYVGYITGHFGRVRALHLRLLSEMSSETPPAGLVLPSAGIFSQDYFFTGLPVSTYCTIVPQSAVIPGLKEMLETELGGETRILDAPETIQARLRCRSTANRGRMEKLLASLVELRCLIPAKAEVNPNTNTTNYVDLPGTSEPWEYCRLAPAVPVYRFADKNLGAPLCRYQEVQTIGDGTKLWDQLRRASQPSTYSDFEISTSGTRFHGSPKLLRAIRRSGAWEDSYVLSTSQSNYLHGLVDTSTGATPLDDESSTRFDNACFITTAPVHVVSGFFSRTRTEIQRDLERVTALAKQQAEKEKRLAEESRHALAAKAAQARKDQEARWGSIVSSALGGRTPSHSQFQKALAALKAEYTVSPQQVTNYTWEVRVKEAFRDTLGAKQFIIAPLSPQVTAEAGKSQQDSGSSVSTLILQQGAPIQQKDVAPKKSGRKSKKKIEAAAVATENGFYTPIFLFLACTNSLPELDDAPALESDTRRRRFPWNPEYDELARDAGAIIRVRCRPKRMDWSALEQVFPGVQRNSVRQRITSLETLPGASEYYRRLDDAWAVLWFQHRGSDALPDPNPDSVSDFDLPAHVAFLREHVDKAALHTGSETLSLEVSKSTLNFTSLDQILADYDITEPSSTPQPTSWDFFFDLASEEPREREFLQHPFAIGTPVIPLQDTPLNVSVAQAAVKMTISTPEASYNSNDAAAMLTLLGDNTVKLAVESMDEWIVRKKSRSGKNYPVRQYTYSDSALAQLKGDFANSIYADAEAMRDHLGGLGNDEWRNIDLTDEDGEIAAYLQLVSENKLEITIDTSIPAAGRNQLGWQSKKVGGYRLPEVLPMYSPETADENLEAHVAIRLNPARQENPTLPVFPTVNNPNDPAAQPPSRLITSCPHLSENHATCLECLEAAESSISAPDQLALLAALRDAGVLGLTVEHILHERYNADTVTASSALAALTQTNPPLAYAVGYDQARIISASRLRDWTVQVVQPQSNSSETKCRVEFPRQWLSIHGNMLEHIWTAATRALAGALMHRPNINEHALRQRYRGLFDRQELNDILEYLLATKKLKRITRTNLPVGMLGPEDEKATYWLLENERSSTSGQILVMSQIPFLEIYSGNKNEFESDNKAYLSTMALLASKASSYGLPSTPEELNEEQQGILSDLSPGVALRFQPPEPLSIGRLVFDLDASAGLTKTCANFISLCKGDKGMCKNAPGKPLHYKNTAIHRIAQDFVMQGGDVTRNDGSGGEGQSIYGGKFADAKEGLKAKPELGSLAMANSGKNSNTSQFFVVLTSDPAKLAKISGKYVVFGKVRLTGGGKEVLERLGTLGGNDEKPTKPVWVQECGVLP
ncbi:hypothetical protein FRC10_000229 [Ceratobasidium sp. 414]|nr:hypothetical protein FRC10_000229 [Ceratobasidium sp. 414]